MKTIIYVSVVGIAFLVSYIVGIPAVKVHAQSTTCVWPHTCVK